MRRGDMTTSQGGQEVTAPENKRGATRGGDMKREGGTVGWEALAWRQQRISRRGGNKHEKNQSNNQI